jgi:hypothetical protein
MKLLAQLQLSNYDTNGIWILECDSGFQMVFGRIREMLKLNSELKIDVIGPIRSTLKTQPEDIVGDLFKTGRVKWIEVNLIANALATRYDFNLPEITGALGLGTEAHEHYDAIYINDPMMLRHYKAMFFLYGKYKPRFYVHSHFIDDSKAPKFPKEASLWLGQCEAAIRADYNFWQCESAMNVFFDEMKDFFTSSVVEYVKQKSAPWDDGYSSEEINTPINMKNIRFDWSVIAKWKKQGKQIIFVPNRIGGRGRSSDYTNCGKFMFDILPELWKRNGNFIVLAGNPSQKFFNHELEKECGPHGYASLVPDAFNRDEFKLIASNSNIAVGLYDQDSYGGTVARECIDLGCVPLWLDNFEYSSITQAVGNWPYLAKPDFSDIVDKATFLLTVMRSGDTRQLAKWQQAFKDVVKKRCSYESSTPEAMKKMELL